MFKLSQKSSLSFYEKLSSTHDQFAVMIDENLTASHAEGLYIAVVLTIFLPLS